MADKWDERKKAQEDEYFVKKERELLEKLKAKQAAESKATAKETARMRCPKCGNLCKSEAFKRSRSISVPAVMVSGWTPVNWSKLRRRKMIAG